MYFQYNKPAQPNLSPIPQRHPDQYAGPNNQQANRPYNPQQQRVPSPNLRPQQPQQIQPKPQNIQHSAQPQRTPPNNVSKPQAPPPKAQPAPAPAPPKKAASERRISTMSEAQIMEKLRSVVSQGDPTTIYNKIKKVGQG
jgi:serine/threonine-protein kinase CLA4